MPAAWPAVSYEEWSATCDTLHAHTQVLGKLAVALAPPEPQLQHAALRLTARGWETAPLPAPDGSGAFVVALDLRATRRSSSTATGAGRRVAAHARPSGGRGDARAARRGRRSRRAPSRSTRRRRRCRGPCRSTRTTSTRAMTPIRSPPTSPRRRRPRSSWPRSARPTAGRSTPVNAWWGSFDLAVNLFSGRPAEPPSNDYIMRNAMDAAGGGGRLVAGRRALRQGGVLRLRASRARGLRATALSPAARAGTRRSASTSSTGTTCARSADPHAVAARLRPLGVPHACSICGWDSALAASAEGNPPPLA